MKLHVFCVLSAHSCSPSFPPLFHITHTVPLPIVTGLEPLIVLLDEEATFTCSASPADAINWTVVDGSGMAVPNIYVMIDGNSSNITVTVSSVGRYQVSCFVANERGEFNDTTTLHAVSTYMYMMYIASLSKYRVYYVQIYT